MLPSGFTSGSTGPTMKFVYDRYFNGHTSALTKYLYSESGVKLSDTFVTIYGRASHSIEYSKKYVTMLGEINETTIPMLKPEKIIKILKKLEPDVINTWPSIITTLANYDLSGVNPRLIFTMGEMVSQHCRDLVKEYYQSELIETYGSVEFEHLAFECEEHRGLHILMDGVCIEFINEDGEYVAPGEQGEIIVTGLRNYAMPLIRYRIGDLGVPTDERCPCGRSWPIIQSIQGRTNDNLILPSGKKIPAGWLYIERLIEKELKKNMFAILYYQIVQKNINQIIINIIKGKNFNTEILDKIKINVENDFLSMGETIEVDFSIVDDIPRGRTGKKIGFVSLL